MNVSMKLKENKIITITEYDDEDMAKLAFEALKANPKMVSQTMAMPGANKLIKGIGVKHEGNKVIVTTEFVNEKVAECFYEINKLVMSNETGND